MRAFLLNILLGATLLITGCASAKVWYQPGKTSAEANRDCGICKMEAINAPVTTTRNLNGLGMFLNQQTVQGNYFDACMMSKGYQKVVAKSVTNGNQYPR
jgi:hypothetical protein